MNSLYQFGTNWERFEAGQPPLADHPRTLAIQAQYRVTSRETQVQDSGQES